MPMVTQWVVQSESYTGYTYDVEFPRGEVIVYHATCKSVAMKESLTEHIRSEDNPADLLTKVITGQKKKHLVSLVLYVMYDEDT